MGELVNKLPYSTKDVLKEIANEYNAEHIGEWMEIGYQIGRRSSETLYQNVKTGEIRIDVKYAEGFEE
ncbi:hypothetical protein [Sphingobacterium mizutaii]|uniref:hypothetical protein n=1 Tax=Sphingobacterium mizutaii TaxID=1010 RepID=UPI001624DF7E|nr:hypothetical protein [Sphingobacterium mizutaii]